ncbi:MULTISPECIES: 2Fe-2S iron-sulfur cluster-binding protein [Photobacterium]|uniref:(2Fe-2S)-binding protein n=1 Tax=Photobacterium halotolerans TaxID=265726 RepID=A0A0F5VEX7_9GAMM|nr:MULTISPECIES: 2Fe-2S iron-sulfur cluster-binding protein [Photobacterium]KKD00613.1 (2Fe-2S)-binding protein [Photobacterium halotolerans]UIP26923.1 2Fe-2S iron-sulfur cluster-binding protein [Photobacterium sp. TLY01]
MSRLTITVNGQKVSGNNDEPLLVQLERAGLQPEYQCRNGMCGACRCKLTAGSVEQREAMAFVAPGEILACRSIPTSDLSLEFDYQVQLSPSAVNE